MSTEKCGKKGCNLPVDRVYYHASMRPTMISYRKQFMHGEHSHTVTVTEDEYKKENPRQVLHRSE